MSSLNFKSIPKLSWPRHLGFSRLHIISRTVGQIDLKFVLDIGTNKVQAKLEFQADPKIDLATKPP